MKQFTAIRSIKNTEATLTQDYNFNRASILDTPLIFELMMNGSENGAFTDRYMVGTGGVKLILFIMQGILGFEKFPNKEKINSRWIIISNSKNPIGFMNYRTINSSDENSENLIAIYAISPSYRNLGHGKAALKLFIQNQPDNTSIIVHCTKYARAMQHILKKLRFQRNPKSGNPTEEYSLTTTPSNQPPSSKAAPS